MFWLFIAGIVLMSDARVMTLELLGIFFTAAAIVLVFATALPGIGFDGAPAINWSNAFLPFGAILFSLAGWTGIEPAYESRKGLRRAFNPWMPLLFGSVFAATLYVLFTAGVLSSVTGLTQDTISSLGSWPVWKRDIIAMLGLFAVATVAMPISREIKNALEKDLRWNAFWSRGVIVLFPIACVLAGLNNFLTVIGIVGGVFLSTQYLLIVSVARRALSLSFRKKVLLDFVAIVFAIAAIYQIITFIVR
jgi:hypothetical protein